MKIFNDDRIQPLTGQYVKKLIKGLDSLDDSTRSLVEVLMEALNKTYRNDEILTSYFDGLIRKGEIKHLSDLFAGERRKALLYLLGEEQTTCFMQWLELRTSIIYSSGWSRRALRSEKAELHYHQALTGDLRQFLAIAATSLSPVSLLEEGKTEEEETLIRYIRNAPAVLAVEIEKGNREVIEKIKEILTGDSTSGKITYQLFLTIFYSSNTELYELTGKLLLAARLQEGLRQSITETMDNGRPEAFIYMLNIIRQNDLQRFSSIKRAVGTWTALFQDAAADHVNQKILDLMYLCLTDPGYANACLDSKDTLEVFMALWSTGFYSVEAGEEQIIRILEEGIKHKIQTALYYSGTTQNYKLQHRIALKALAEYREDDSIIVGYINEIMPEMYLYHASEKCAFQITHFFTGEEHAREVYTLLKQIADRVKKEQIFSPYLFPWYEKKLEKSSILRKMLYIGYFLQDINITDDLCTYAEEMGSDLRPLLIKQVIGTPQTDLQLNIVIQALGDRAETPRAVAYNTLHEFPLQPVHFRELEDKLRFKSGDLRQNIIKLLIRQSPEELAGTVKRLLADKLVDKRLGAMDLLLQVKEKPEYTEMLQKSVSLLDEITKPTSKETVLIEQLQNSNKPGQDIVYTKENGYGLLLTDEQVKMPLLPLKPGFKIKDYFPLNQQQVFKLVEKISQLITKHAEHEYTSKYGSTYLIGRYLYPEKGKENEEREIDQYPLADLWKKFYEKEIKDFPVLLQLDFVFRQRQETAFRRESFGTLINKFYGMDLEALSKQIDTLHYKKVTETLLSIWKKEYWNAPVAYSIYRQVFPQLLLFIQGTKEKPDTFNPELNILNQKHLCFERLYKKYTYGKEEKGVESVLFCQGASYWMNHIFWETEEEYPDWFYIQYARYKALNFLTSDPPFISTATSLGCQTMSKAYETGLIPEEELIRRFLIYNEALDTFKNMIRYLNEFKDPKTKDIPDKFRRQGCRKMEQVFNKITNRILDIELKRGDLPTPVSPYALTLQRIEGADIWINLLKALGKDTFDRLDYHYDSKMTKKEVLSHLLRICHPAGNDNAQTLAKLLKDTDITEKRLIEAAMYCPQWLEIIEQYTGWKGLYSAAYYFHAHMNEYFDERKKAIIARFTPIETEDLKLGAFDIKWFLEAYKGVGEKRFEVIYDAAKYICSGGAHTRARKFADAVTGKLDIKTVRKEIEDKRNKDLLMSYCLIPLNKRSKKDLPDRYQYLQQFLKESKQFGAQRQESEKKAVEIGLQNLARNAGYDDVTRLIWSMETRLLKDMSSYFTPKNLEGTEVFVQIDEEGKSSVCYLKDGKFLNSTPAKLKKNKYIEDLKEIHKKLKNQYSRSRIMLEQAMEDSTWFLAEELSELTANPVIWPLMQHLVFTDETGRTGFFRQGTLEDYKGETSSLQNNTLLRIAHVTDLYKQEVWYNYQKHLFDGRIRQPFKQVFRELYIKTEEEKPMTHSLRYAGNQIQPQKTVAVLKNRRWVANHEDGLQKIYYKENIIASIYALADWFSPSDIEAPTLEWVAFFDRKTYKPVPVEQIPDILFSEIMRDVDLAVSVAHAGGVDPESSHSTIEMRSAIIAFTLPLFRLENVRLKGSHAFIEGKRGNYNIHLGSGIIHQEAGAALNVLPVHSQHRGRLFLPFADDDPKTAEIISKIILFAEDEKIKDPFILDQIKKR